MRREWLRASWPDENDTDAIVSLWRTNAGFLIGVDYDRGDAFWLHLGPFALSVTYNGALHPSERRAALRRRERPVIRRWRRPR